MSEPNGLGFEVMLGAFADLGKQSADQHKQLMGAVSSPRALHKTTFGTVTASPSQTPFLLSVNNPATPASGRIWNIRGVAMFGPDLHTAVTGAVDFYAGAAPLVTDPGGAILPVFPDALNGSSTIPYATTYARHAYWCGHGETVYALVYGVTANTQLTLVATYEDFLVSEVEPMGVI